MNYSQTIAKDCADLYKKGYRIDGVYLIDSDGQGAFKVRCDMTTSGGGWTIIQRRVDGSVSFIRKWVDYKDGFGDPHSEYWLGLEHIKRQTNTGKMVLRVDMEDTAGNTKYAEYDFFAVASEVTKYKLSLGTYSGKKTLFYNDFKVTTALINIINIVRLLLYWFVCTTNG